jgi:hypothetical protein
VPPFRGGKRSDPRSAFLRFRTIADTRAVLHMLDGWVGPGGRWRDVACGIVAPAGGASNSDGRWVYEVEEMEKSGGGEEGEACLEEEWGGLGFRFGTGEEEQNDAQGVEH